MYDKLTKQELVTLAEEKDKELLIKEEIVANFAKSLDEQIKAWNKRCTNISALVDLVELATDVKPLDGLNETQVNAALIKRLRLIKHTIGNL